MIRIASRLAEGVRVMDENALDRGVVERQTGVVHPLASQSARGAPGSAAKRSNTPGPAAITGPPAARPPRPG